MKTLPTSSFRATFLALFSHSLNTEASNPKWEEFAISTASSSSLTLMMSVNGPKTSS